MVVGRPTVSRATSPLAPRERFLLAGGRRCLYSLCVETKTALVLGGGGITGGMYELGALAADRFLQQAPVPGARRRFGLTRQTSTVSAR